MCNIYGPIIQILMCVFYFTRTESDVLTNRIQIFVSWSVVKQSKDKKKRREEEEEEEEKPTAEGLRCILYVAQQRNDVHKTLSLKRWYTLSYCLSCSANSSGKKNSKRQVAYVDSESIHIHQSQEDSRVDTTLFNKEIDCFNWEKAGTRSERLTAIMTGTGNSTRD